MNGDGFHIPISRSSAFPNLEPASAQARRRRARGLSRTLDLSQHIELIHDSALEDETQPERREEPKNLTATLTVYVFNLILLVISFPVGMAILIFNIVGGENLRTTAHAIALTGMAIALAHTELGQAIVQAI